MHANGRTCMLENGAGHGPSHVHSYSVESSQRLSPRKRKRSLLEHPRSHSPQHIRHSSSSSHSSIPDAQSCQQPPPSTAPSDGPPPVSPIVMGFHPTTNSSLQEDPAAMDTFKRSLGLKAEQLAEIQRRRNKGKYLPTVPPTSSSLANRRILAKNRNLTISTPAFGATSFPIRSAPSFPDRHSSPTSRPGSSNAPVYSDPLVPQDCKPNSNDSSASSSAASLSRPQPLQSKVPLPISTNTNKNISPGNSAKPMSAATMTVRIPPANYPYHGPPRTALPVFSSPNSTNPITGQTMNHWSHSSLAQNSHMPSHNQSINSYYLNEFPRTAHPAGQGFVLYPSPPDHSDSPPQLTQQRHPMASNIPTTSSINSAQHSAPFLPHGTTIATSSGPGGRYLLVPASASRPIPTTQGIPTTHMGNSPMNGQPHPNGLSQHPPPSSSFAQSRNINNSSGPSKQQFMATVEALFDSFMEANTNMRVSLEEQISRAVNQVASAQQNSATMLENMVDKKLGEMCRSMTEDIQLLESRIEKIERDSDIPKPQDEWQTTSAHYHTTNVPVMPVHHHQHQHHHLPPVPYSAAAANVAYEDDIIMDARVKQEEHDDLLMGETMQPAVGEDNDEVPRNININNAQGLRSKEHALKMMARPQST